MLIDHEVASLNFQLQLGFPIRYALIPSCGQCPQHIPASQDSSRNGVEASSHVVCFVVGLSLGFVFHVATQLPSHCAYLPSCTTQNMDIVWHPLRRDEAFSDVLLCQCTQRSTSVQPTERTNWHDVFPQAGDPCTWAPAYPLTETLFTQAI